MFLDSVGNAAINLLLIFVEVPFLSLEIREPLFPVPVTTTSVRFVLTSVRTTFILVASPN